MNQPPILATSFNSHAVQSLTFSQGFPSTPFSIAGAFARDSSVSFLILNLQGSTFQDHPFAF